MTKYVEAGKGSTHQIQFMVDNELVVPTSATYTLLDNASQVVEDIEDEVITLSDSSTSVVISIPADANQLVNPTEIRYISVKFIYNAIDYTIETYYRLRESIRFPLTIDEVRAVLGSTGIPDEYIDILGAYDQVAIEAIGVNVETILTSGGALLPYLIDAVKYKAALSTGINLETSMMQSEQADNTVYKRFSKIDFNALRSSLVALYNLALSQLNGTNQSSGGLVIPLLSILAQGTDPVTGQ